MGTQRLVVEMQEHYGFDQFYETCLCTAEEKVKRKRQDYKERVKV